MKINKHGILVHVLHQYDNQPITHVSATIEAVSEVLEGSHANRITPFNFSLSTPIPYKRLSSFDDVIPSRVIQYSRIHYNGMLYTNALSDNPDILEFLKSGYSTQLTGLGMYIEANPEFMPSMVHVYTEYDTETQKSTLRVKPHY